jgi:pyruvate/2-oxoglutarate dehydrogenase complex dihydrolipoamide dehydrogenase (E3) component
MTEIAKPDLCVIGGGHAGLAVARRAAGRGASVIVIEPGRLGGAGRLADRAPITALAAAGTRAHLLRKAGEYGLAPAEPKVSLRALSNHIARLVADMERDDAAERCAALGIEVIADKGCFTDRRTFVAGDRTIRARRFVIAMEPEPVIPAIAGLADVPYFTRRTIGGNTRKLSHLMVIGGGATGLAVAQAYKRLGAQVSVVDKGRMLAGHDPELAAVLLRCLREEAIALYEETAIAAINKRGQGIGVTLAGKDGETQLDISHVLVAAGDGVDLSGLDVEKSGLRVGADGRLVAGSDFRTNNRAIFAMDATRDSTELMAATTVDNALGGKRRQLPAEAVPRIVACDPMLAEIGLTEKQARARYKQNYRVVRCGLAESDAARAASLTGSVRLILDGGDRVVGAGLVGPDVAELAALFGFVIAQRLNVAALADFAPPTGSLGEIAPILADKAQRSAASRSRGGRKRWLPLPGRTL